MPCHRHRRRRRVPAPDLTDNQLFAIKLTEVQRGGIACYIHPVEILGDTCCVILDELRALYSRTRAAQEPSPEAHTERERLCARFDRMAIGLKLIRMEARARSVGLGGELRLTCHLSDDEPPGA